MIQEYDIQLYMTASDEDNYYMVGNFQNSSVSLSTKAMILLAL